MNVTQVSCKGIFIIYKLTFNSNSSTLLCVTVTEDPCNVFPLFPSGHSILLLLFVSLLTHFHNYAVWTATHFFCFFFHSVFQRNCFVPSWFTVTQGPCNISSLFRSVHSILLFPFESLMTHSYNYIV